MPDSDVAAMAGADVGTGHAEAATAEIQEFRAAVESSRTGRGVAIPSP